MAHEMFNAVKRLCDAEPFRPFVMVLDGGEEIAIHHRDFSIPMKGWDLLLVQRPEDPEGRLLNPEHIREITRPRSQSTAA